MLCQQKVPLKDILDKAESWGAPRVDQQIEKSAGSSWCFVYGTHNLWDFHRFSCILWHTVYLKSIDIWCREQAMDLHWNIFCHEQFKVLGSSMIASRRESQWLSTIQRQDVLICRPQHQRFDAPFRSSCGYHFPEASVAKCKERGSFSLLGACYCSLLQDS